MIRKQKTLMMWGLVLLCIAAAALAGAMRISGDASRWTSHADISWYDPDLPSFTIDTPAKLAGVAKLVNENVHPNGDIINGFYAKTFDIDRNLDLSAYLWEPIGTPEHPFKGTMYSKDGAAFTISGLKLAPETTYAGLIGVLDGGTFGGFVFAANGSFSLHNSWQDLYAGAAVGHMINNGKVYNITNYLPIQAGSVNASVYGGGIVGMGDGEISNTVNHAAVTVNGASAYGGGIAGSGGGPKLVIKKAENNGAVTANGFGATGDVYAGGIAAYAADALYMDDESTPIDNTGAVTATGGLHSHAGGILAKAAAEVTFSLTTSNTGAVSVNAPQAAGSYAGGLVGSIAAEQETDLFAVNFTNTGSIDNNGGNNVHTGGIAGYVSGSLRWNGNFTNGVAVGASGANGVYTGGLIGYISGEVQLLTPAANTAAIRVSGASNGAYTGGLIGFAGNRVLFEAASTGAYGNSGDITVAGGKEVYTGGIVANKAYARLAGDPVVNVTSTANIAISGEAGLYTGGYIGAVADGADRAIHDADFGAEIAVTASAPSEEQPVRTGGIVGYADNVQAIGGVFRGTLQATGGRYVYTGGIAGDAENSSLSDVRAGNTGERYALIVSDGTIGGIAGRFEGAIHQATAEFLDLKLTANNGVAGGIAGVAQGQASGVTAGRDGYADGDSVRIEAAEGIQPITAGGIVGLNAGSFELLSGTVANVALVNANGTGGHRLGGIAGLLTAEAKLGEPGAPVVARGLEIAIEADDSDIGGVAGVSHASELHALAEEISIAVHGDRVNAGLLAGSNKGAIDAGASSLTARDGQISGNGAHASLGGLFGENVGEVPASLTQFVTIEASGSDNRLGGVAGYNTGSISNSDVWDLALTLDGANGAAGGVAGLSEKAEGGIAPVITAARVTSEEAVLLTVTQNATEASAGGIVGHAKSTEIAQSDVTADDGASTTIIVRAERAAAGGIAGRMESGRIAGDTFAANVQNLLLTTSEAASDAYAGGIVGYNDESRLDRVVGHGVTLLLNGSNATAGGMAGYNRGTDTAIITRVYIEGLHIRANASAADSILGGFVGVNDARREESALSPSEASSTIQKSRYIGMVGGGSSQAILAQAPGAIVGGMAGENRSLIANNSIADRVAVSATGSGSVIGGLVGINDADGTLYYTYSNANLNIAGAGTLGGGLVGENKGRVLSSYIETDVTGSAEGAPGEAIALGGLIGRNSGTVDKSYAASKVTATGDYANVGGLVGEQTSGTISNSYVVKEVSAAQENSYVGGALGRITGGQVQYVYSASKVAAAGGAHAGGFAGRYDNASKELLYKAFYAADESFNADLTDFGDGNYRWLNLTARLDVVTPAELRDREFFPVRSGWDFDGIWRYGSLQAEFQYPELIRSANTGDEDGGSDVNVNINWYTRDPFASRYELSTESELAGLAAIVNGTVPGLPIFDFAGREIAIAGPIHIQSSQWVPIGSGEDAAFEGIFNGGSHLIDGLVIRGSAHRFNGLFGYIGENGEVRNLVLEPLLVEGDGYTGTVAGYNKGLIENIAVNLLDGAKVEGNIVGSFLGGNENVFRNISVALKGDSRVEAFGENAIAGGLIGRNLVPLAPDTFTLNVEEGSVGSLAQGATVGGLIGSQEADAADIHTHIVQNYQIGAEGEGSVVGGLFGTFRAGQAERLSVVFKDGTLRTFGANSVLGGIIGHSEPGTAISDVSVTAEQAGSNLNGTGTVGGIVGQLTDAQVRDAAFAAAVRASGVNATAGGIVGYAQNSIIQRVNSDGDIAIEAGGGTGSVGGIAGISESDDRDRAYDFGLWAPLYHGIYDATAESRPIAATGLNNNSADLYVGGLVGRNINASIYQSTAKAGLTVQGAKVAAAGGIAGYNEDGILVRLTAQNVIDAGTSSIYEIGGIAGRSDGGEIHYTRQFAPAGGKLTAGDAIARPGVAPATYAGGFVGRSKNTDIAHSSTDIPIDIASTNADNMIYAGGFAGLLGDGANASAKLSQVYATGSVTVKATGGSIAGGFAGSIDWHTVTDAYASGEISNTGKTIRSGGFTGILERDAAIEGNVYAVSPKLEAVGAGSPVSSYTGGFAGYNDGTIRNAYAGTAVISVNASGANVHTGALVGFQFSAGELTDNTYAADLVAVGRTAGNIRDNAHAVIDDPLATNDWNYDHELDFLTEPVGDEIAIATTARLRGAVLFYNASTGLEFYLLYNRDPAAVRPAVTKLALEADLDVTGFNMTPFEQLAQGHLFDGRDYAIKGYSLKAGGDRPEAFGFVAVNHGEIVNVIFDGASIQGGEATGVVAGVNGADGIIRNVVVRGQAEGLDAVGGIAGINEGTIDNAEVDGQVTGVDAVGGIAGINEGTIDNAEVDAQAEGHGATGGIAGVNKGAVRKAGALIQAKGIGAIGGIAGVNEGLIEQAYARGTVQELLPDGTIAAGGIAGDNAAGGSIERSFAYADVTVAGNEVTAGGIAGLNRGNIAAVFNSGYVRADGQTMAQAGGIVGYAQAGAIDSSLNTGEVVAGSAGTIVPGKAFFGGIAGQKADGATITGSVFNKQMLKRNTAYYDANGNRVTGANAAAEGLTASRLAGGSLPAQLAGANWTAAQGFYPRLAAFDNHSAAVLGAVAVILADKDTVNAIGSSFGLTRSADVAWTADAGQITIRTSGSATTGTLGTTAAARLIATVNGEQRRIVVNAPAWKFAETALAPIVVSGDRLFTDTVTVVLGTNEPDGIIYYTTDGSRPTEESARYTQPLELAQTTTLRAVVIVDTKEESALLVGTWTKSAGMGGFFPIIPPADPEPSIIATTGTKTSDGTVEEPVKVAINSKLKLTAPEGHVIYYTTDGTEPTKDSPQFKGELVITGNMTIKAITDKDDRVVTIVYEVESAKYELKQDAADVKYMTAYPDGTFRPSAAMTRLELIRALEQLLDKEDTDLANLFEDVRAADGDAVAFFASAGIIEGYPDGTFGGDRGLKRAEFAVILSRLLKMDIRLQGETVLSDISGHWAEKYINAFTARGYIKGFPDGTFRPEALISRAEAVAMINRIIGAKPLNSSIRYSDLPPDHWAYEEIMAVTE